MFLLFIFITIFLLFHKDLGDSIQNITRDEANYALLQIKVLTGQKEYDAKMDHAMDYDIGVMHIPDICYQEGI